MAIIRSVRFQVAFQVAASARLGYRAGNAGEMHFNHDALFAPEPGPPCAARPQRLAARTLRNPAPKPSYDVVVVGGGGHGLATAYYLAKNHGIRNVAVLEKAGSAAAIPCATPRSSARTTSLEANAQFYEHSAEAVGGALARPQLQLSCSRSAASSTSRIPTADGPVRAARQRHAPQRASTPTCSVATRSAPWSPTSISPPSAVSHLWRPAAAARLARRGTTRSPGALPAAPMRAASTSSRIARSPASCARATRSSASRRREANHPGRQGRARGRRPHRPGRGDGRAAPADRDASPAGPR